MLQRLGDQRDVRHRLNGISSSQETPRIVQKRQWRRRQPDHSWELRLKSSTALVPAIAYKHHKFSRIAPSHSIPQAITNAQRRVIFFATTSQWPRASCSKRKTFHPSELKKITIGAVDPWLYSHGATALVTVCSHLYQSTNFTTLPQIPAFCLAVLRFIKWPTLNRIKSCSQGSNPASTSFYSLNSVGLQIHQLRVFPSQNRVFL